MLLFYQNVHSNEFPYILCDENTFKDVKAELVDYRQMSPSFRNCMYVKLTHSTGLTEEGYLFRDANHADNESFMFYRSDGKGMYSRSSIFFFNPVKSYYVEKNALSSSQNTIYENETDEEEPVEKKKYWFDEV